MEDEHNLSIDDLMETAIRVKDTCAVRCNCHSTCSTKKCPCKALSTDCTRSCTCGTKTKCCRNNKPVPEDSDDSSEVDDESDDDSIAENAKAGPSRKRHRADENNDGGLGEHMARLQLQDTLIKDFVATLAVDQLKRVCIDLLRRNPGAYSDYVAMRSIGEDGDIGFNDLDEAYEHHIHQEDDNTEERQEDENSNESGQDAPPGPNPPPRGPQQPTPSWCRCAHCREMPTDIEKKCCRPRRNQRCMALTGEFVRLCLDNMVLEIAMRVHEDLVADDPVRNNAAYRHQAYRCYIYWQHGRLGQGNRQVIPSCVVWAIRDMWPEPTGIYKGFVPGGMGHLND